MNEKVKGQERLSFLYNLMRHIYIPFSLCYIRPSCSFRLTYRAVLIARCLPPFLNEKNKTLLRNMFEYIITNARLNKAKARAIVCLPRFVNPLARFYFYVMAKSNMPEHSKSFTNL